MGHNTLAKTVKLFSQQVENGTFRLKVYTKLKLASCQDIAMHSVDTDVTESQEAGAREK